MSYDFTGGLSPREIAAAKETLAKLEPGLLPLDIFLQVARLCVTTTVEMVPLRHNLDNGKDEVLLVRRESDDPIWPNMLHIPGTVLRSTDRQGDYSDAFKRIFDGELGGVKTDGEPVFIRNAFQQVKRGRELALVHYVELSEQPPNGQFYATDELPEDLVDHQLTYIREASELFTDNQDQD